MRPTQTIAALMQEVKRDSSAWINIKKLVPGRFSWQSGYAAFSYSKSHVSRVINYINSQESHHKNKTFIDEYREILDKFEVVYDNQYLFLPVIDNPGI